MVQRVLTTIAVLFLSAAAAFPRVILSDNFSYPDGPLVLLSDGVWKTHSGTAGQVEVLEGQIRLSQKKTEDVSAPFPGGPLSTTNAVAVYARFSANFSALATGSNGTYFAHFKDGSATSGLRCRIFATTNGAASGCYRVGIAAGANAATALLPDDLKLSTRYRLVCRMVLADNQSTLWLNPNAETDPGATSTDEAAPKTVAAIAFRQSLASGAGMGELAVDDLVVTTEFAELLADADPPAVIRDLEDKSVAAGQSVIFEIQASGTPPLSYQWFCNGSELPGADGPALSLGPVGDEHAGAYQVIVSNAAGSVTSAEVWLTVEPALFLVSIQYDTVTGVQLEWVADPEQTYSVWSATSPDGEYSMVCEGLQFVEGEGRFEDGPIQGAMRFYRLGAP